MDSNRFILFLLLIIPSGYFGPGIATASTSCYTSDCKKLVEDKNCKTTYVDKPAASSFGLMLSSYADQHILYSLYYLKLSTSMGLYTNNRPGFKRLFKKLSDECWEKSQNIIKYINNRGFDFTHDNDLNKLINKKNEKQNKKGGGQKPNGVNQNNNMPEREENGQNNRPKRDTDRNKSFSFSIMPDMNDQISSYVARSIDFQKDLAKNAFTIHKESSNDPDIRRYLEDEFITKQSETVRYLTGLLGDIVKLYKSAESKTDNEEDKKKYKKKDNQKQELSFYILDEYLRHHSY